MTASCFVVVLPDGAKTLKNGMDAIAVWANSATDARAMAAAQADGDSDALWASTESTATAVVAATDFTGWRLRVVLKDNNTPFTVIDKTVTGVSTNTIADIAALMVTALNATVINGAAYSTPTLTLAQTTDGMGDWEVYVFLYPPSVNVVQDISIAGYLSTIVSRGASGDALSVVLNDSLGAASVPAGFRLHK